MFDRFTEKRRARHPRLVLILSVSVVGHLVAAVSLIVAGLWQIEKLMPPSRSLTVDVGPRSTKTPEPQALDRIKPRAVKPKATNKVRKELMQPDPNATEVDSDVDVEYTSAPEYSGPTSSGTGGTGDGAFNIGTPTGPAIPFHDIPVLPKLEKLPEVKKVVNIPAHFLDGKRISGNERIMPPDTVRIAMLRLDQRKLDGSVKMCLGRDGGVNSLRTLRTTGYPAYDQKLLREMRHWRYRPYTVNGEPVAVCAPIVFIYRMIN